MLQGMSVDSLQPDLYAMEDKKIRASSFNPSTRLRRVHSYEDIDIDDVCALSTLFTHDYVQGDEYEIIEIDNCSLSDLSPPSLIPPHHHKNTTISTVSDETDSPE